jgi:hypothetical protein
MFLLDIKFCYKIQWMRKILLMLTIISGITSCRDYVRLTPAPEAQEVEGINHAAKASVAGVNVIVQARAWVGTTAIKTEVTPLKLTVENNTNKSIRIRYSDFALISSTGEHFAALPPYAIEGTIEEPVRIHPRPGIVAPRFFHEGFHVAPHFSPYFDRITAFDGAFFYDPFYYNRYYTYWQEIELPTIEMLQEALPDGVIDPGGKVIGFLYFETVTPDIQRVVFRMDIADARDGTVLGTANIPFNVN